MTQFFKKSLASIIAAAMIFAAPGPAAAAMVKKGAVKVGAPVKLALSAEAASAPVGARLSEADMATISASAPELQAPAGESSILEVSGEERGVSAPAALPQAEAAIIAPNDLVEGSVENAAERGSAVFEKIKALSSQAPVETGASQALTATNAPTLSKAEVKRREPTRQEVQAAVRRAVAEVDAQDAGWPSAAIAAASPFAQAAWMIRHPVQAAGRITRAAAAAGMLLLAGALAACGGGNSSDSVVIVDNNSGYFPITQQQVENDMANATPIDVGWWSTTAPHPDYDTAYWIQAGFDGVLSVRVPGVFAAQLDLLLVDVNGNVVARHDTSYNWSDATFAAQVTAGQYYYVIVHNKRTGGSGLPMELDIQLNDFFDATPYHYDAYLNGEFFDEDMFRFNVYTSASRLFYVEGVANVELGLELYDQDGNFVAQSDLTARGEDAFINFSYLAAGNYTLIVVNRSGGGTGQYYPVDVY